MVGATALAALAHTILASASHTSPIAWTAFNKQRVPRWAVSHSLPVGSASAPAAAQATVLHRI